MSWLGRVDSPVLSKPRRSRGAPKGTTIGVKWLGRQDSNLDLWINRLAGNY